MKVIITVYLQGTMKEYEQEGSLENLIKDWENHGQLIITTRQGLVYIERKQCPIVEFKEVTP